MVFSTCQVIQILLLLSIDNQVVVCIFIMIAQMADLFFLAHCLCELMHYEHILCISTCSITFLKLCFKFFFFNFVLRVKYFRFVLFFSFVLIVEASYMQGTNQAQQYSYDQGGKSSSQSQVCAVFVCVCKVLELDCFSYLDKYCQFLVT